MDKRSRLDVSGSGGGGHLLTPTLELDESGNAGRVHCSSGGLTFVYDANDIGGLTETGADGEDDNTGDYSISYSVGVYQLAMNMIQMWKTL